MDKADASTKEIQSNGTESSEAVSPGDTATSLTMRAIQWSGRSYTLKGLLSEFALRHRLPIIVKAAHGYQGENPVETVDHEQVVLLKGWEHQERVVVQDNHGRLLSVPLEWSVKFKVNERKWKRSKPKHLKEIVQNYRIPVRIAFDKLPKWKFRVGKKEVTNLRFGGLVLRDVYTEHYLLGMPINNGSIELEKEKMLTLPLYTDVHFFVAEGLDTGTAEEFAALINMYSSAVSNVKFSRMYGTEDAFLYKKEYILFNKTLATSLAAESTGGLKQDFGGGGRLLPAMNMITKSSDRTADRKAGQGHVLKSKSANEAGAATVLVNKSNSLPQSRDTSARQTTSAHAQTEEEAGHSTDSGVVDATKDAPSSAPNMVSTALQTNGVQSHVEIRQSNGVGATHVTLHGVTSGAVVRGSNEYLNHDEDALPGLGAPWGYDGGRYRSLVTVSHAGSDIVSDVDDDVDVLLSLPRRTKHLSLPRRKEQPSYPRYGTVVTDMPAARRPYVTRSVSEVRQMAPPTETRHYSLRRIQGSGPMRYYIPDLSSDRLYDSLRRRSYTEVPTRHRGLQIGLSGGQRDTMSEVGAPTYRSPPTVYRMPYSSSLSINIPEDSLSSVDYNSNYLNNDYHGDDYDVTDDRYGDWLPQPSPYSHAKKRSQSARRHNERQSEIMSYEPHMDYEMPRHGIRGHAHAPVTHRGRTQARDNVLVEERTLRAHTDAPLEESSVRVLHVARRHSARKPVQRTSSFVNVNTGEVTRMPSSASTRPVTVTSRDFEHQSGSLMRNRELRSMSLGRPRHMRAVPIIYSDSEEEHVRIPVAKRTSSPPVYTANSVPQFARESHRDWSKAYEQPMANNNKAKETSPIVTEPAYVYDSRNDLRQQTGVDELADSKQKYSKDPVPSQISYDDVIVAELETVNPHTNLQQKQLASQDRDSTNLHSRPVDVRTTENNTTKTTATVDQIVSESSCVGKIDVNSQNVVQIPFHESHTRHQGLTENVPSLLAAKEPDHAETAAKTTVDKTETVPQSPPNPPPLPPVSPSCISSNSSELHTKDAARGHSRTSSSSAQSARESLHSELKTRLAKRTESMEAQKENIGKSSGSHGDATDEIVKRDGTGFAKAVERASANSLRQVYTLERTSIEGLINVDKAQTQLDDILKRDDAKTDSHDTLKSSGYGSVSSKTEMSVNVSKSTTSKAYLEPLPSPTRGKHDHTNPDNPWVFEHSDSLREGHKVRESIISIRELDEYLKQQSVGAESDSESVKHFETANLAPADLEFTHL